MTEGFRNFRICLCLEMGSKAEEAIPYCQKAISICKSRVQRLTNEVRISTGTSAVSVSDHAVQMSSNGSQSNGSDMDKEADIEILTGLSLELEKKASVSEVPINFIA